MESPMPDKKFMGFFSTWINCLNVVHVLFSVAY